MDMKIAFAADAHFGMHGNSEPYAKSIDNAFSSMASHLIHGNVNSLILLGDVFDARFSINQMAEDNARRCIEELEKNFIEVAMLTGNHDSYYANTTKINSLNKFSRIAKVINKPTVIFDEILALPWICEENQEECMNAIKNAKVPYCAGHFDIYGARMNNSKLSDTGMKPSVFKKFGKVLSGHFHSRQAMGNIEYIGSMIQTSFADEGEKRGFSILDTDSGTTEFVELDGMKHIRVFLEEERNLEDFKGFGLKGANVELTVSSGLWEDDRLVRRAEKAIMEAGAANFAGSKKDLGEASKKIDGMPSMKRDESLMDYIDRYVRDNDVSDMEGLRKELKRLYEAVVA